MFVVQGSPPRKRTRRCDSGMSRTRGKGQRKEEPTRRSKMSRQSVGACAVKIELGKGSSSQRRGSSSDLSGLVVPVSADEVATLDVVEATKEQPMIGKEPRSSVCADANGQKLSGMRPHTLALEHVHGRPIMPGAPLAASPTPPKMNLASFLQKVKQRSAVLSSPKLPEAPQLTFSNEADSESGFIVSPPRKNLLLRRSNTKLQPLGQTLAAAFKRNEEDKEVSGPTSMQRRLQELAGSGVPGKSQQRCLHPPRSPILDEDDVVARPINHDPGGLRTSLRLVYEDSQESDA